MKDINYLLILVILLVSLSCCDEQTSSFSENQRQLIPELEEGTKGLLISEFDTIEYEVLWVTNDFINSGSYTGPCKDSEEISWIEFSNGTAFYIGAHKSGFEMRVIVSLGSVFKDYRIQSQGSIYNLIDKYDESIVSEDVINFFNSFPIGTNEFDKVVQIVETDEFGNVKSELLYNKDSGLLRYSTDSITYEFQEYI